MADNGLKIGEVVERTGLSIPTLRHYDDVGLVPPSGRSPGGFRLYSEEDVHRILLIRRMKPLGFSLEQMRNFLDAATFLEGQEGAGPEEKTQAEVTLTTIRDETRTRYEKLRKQLGYAEEFLNLVNSLKP